MISVERTIISQYANSPTIVQLVKNIDLYLDPRADLDTFYSYVFNVDTAVGFGLDIWGRIVGVNRSIEVPPSTPNPSQLPFQSGAYTLDDTQFRKVILFKALANITNGTAAGLNNLLSNLFEGRGRCYVRDLGSMSTEFTFEFWLEPFEYVIITSDEITPRPAGVLANVYQIDINKTFGFMGTGFQPFNQGTFFTR